MSIISILNNSFERSRIIDTSLLTTPRQLTNNCASWRSPMQGLKRGPSYRVVKHKVVYPADSIRLRFMCHGWAGVEYIEAEVQIRVNGEYYPVKFNGQDLYLPRTEMIDSDSVNVSVRAGDIIYVIMNHSGRQDIPYGSKISDSNVSSISTSYPDFNLTSSSFTGSALYIYGETYSNAKSFLCMGDSIVEQGWMRKAAEAHGLAWSDISEWAQKIPTPYPYGRYDSNDTPLFSLGLSEYATNNRDESPELVKKKLINYWLETKRICDKLGQTTMVPYTSGDYASQNQRETHKEWRDELNRWLRLGAPMNRADMTPALSGDFVAGVEGHPLVGICDIAKSVELVVGEQTIWNYKLGYLTPDGGHPTPLASDIMQPVVYDWISKHIA